MKKTLLIASLLTSVLAVAGTTGSVEFNNNTKSTVTNFTKDGVKDAITGTEFDSGLKGEIKVNDLFAAGFEIGNKNAFDNFTVNKDTLFKHGEPSVWFEVMKDGNYFKTTLKPHKFDKLTPGTGDGTIVSEDYLPGPSEKYQSKTPTYVLRPGLELNLQKSLDDLTFKANVKSEFNAISKKITGQKFSSVIKEDNNNDRVIDHERSFEKVTFVDPKLSFDFSASKGDLAGVKDATADVMLDFKGEELGFARTGLTLSGNYDLDKTTNIALEAKVDYKKQDVKSLNKEFSDKIIAARDAEIKNESLKDHKDLKDTKNLIDNFFGDDTMVPEYKEFKEKVLDSNNDAVKAYYKNAKKSVDVESLDEVYYGKLNDAFDRKLDLGEINHSYALDATYKLGDQLSLGSSAYLYHAYFGDNENLVNAVLGATLDANVNAFHFGTEVKGLAMNHFHLVAKGSEKDDSDEVELINETNSTLALRAKADTSYKFNLVDGLTFTPEFSADILASSVVNQDQIPKKISASVTPKASLEYMKNGFDVKLSLESKYNFSNKYSLDEYFATKKNTDKVSYNDFAIMNNFGFVNNVFKAGLTLGYNW